MSRRSIVVGLFLTLAVIFLSFTISALSRSSISLKSFTNETKVNQEQRTRLEAEMLVLRAEGFHPKEITRPAGRFLLVIHNHSTVDEISLVLKEEQDAARREMRTSRRQTKLRELVDLPPGRYVLVEANRPEWNCTIVITPN